MPATPIDAARFWDLYFRDAFRTLQRGAGGYTGLTNGDPGGTGYPLGFLRRASDAPIEIGSDALHGHDYAGDGRFALIAQRPTDPRAAWDAVIAQTYPYRDPPPFGKRRMAQLFGELAGYGVPGQGPLSLGTLDQIALGMVKGHSEALDQPLAALAWLLGEQRHRESSAALLAIIDNAAFLPGARHRIHFTAVSAALQALWKVNDKASLPHLLDEMRAATVPGQRTIAPLFERLLSTDELLGQKRCGDDYLRPGFWSDMLDPRRSFTPSDWDRYDAGSLFWEIRYLAALRLPTADADTLARLAADEVPMVRAAAARGPGG